MPEIVTVFQRVINAAIINAQKEIFLVQKGNVWILPGGKPRESESDLECLMREIDEELSGTLIEPIISYYKSFQGVSPSTKTQIQVDVYFSQFRGDVHAPSSEICASAWTKSPKEYSLSDTTLQIVNRLINDRYL